MGYIVTGAPETATAAVDGIWTHSIIDKTWEGGEPGRTATR